MIIVDSSVWIAALRRDITPAVRALHILTENRDDKVALGDLILMEVLHGARNERDAGLIERALRCFPILPMLGEDIAVQAARNDRLLRARGIIIRKSADMIIGTFCIQQNHILLHQDRDFDSMTEQLGLRRALRPAA